MDRETIDVIDDTGTDAGWQRGIALGRKAAYIQANDGGALGGLGTANGLRGGCQSSLLRMRRGSANLLDAERRPRPIKQFRPPGSRLEATAYQCVAPIGRAFLFRVMPAMANAVIPPCPHFEPLQRGVTFMSTLRPKGMPMAAKSREDDRHSLEPVLSRNARLPAEE
jgi:hypothetical protein